jgi:hypothetical protein
MAHATMDSEKGIAMKTTLTALATAATIAIASVAAPSEAEARWRGGWWVPGAVIGGLAAGAIIGGLARPYYYGPGPYYYGGPVYYGPPCYWQRQREWDGYRWRVARVRVCY